jgi:multicomponent Na+:H+ antiporter subunit D
MSEWAHPAWPYLAAALLALALPERARPALLAGPTLAVVLACSLPDGGTLTGRVMGVELVLARADALSRMFAIVFALIGGLAGLYAGPGAGRRLHVAGFAATAAGLVIVLAGDWITLYLGWEALAIASFAIVTDGGTPRAWQAAYRYLLVHFAGDALLLAGIAWHLARGGSGLVGALPADGARLLFLVAFAINAAIPPVHAWLTDAYPESSPAGTVFLSAFATKAAVYALARAFPGWEPLVWAGVGMTLYGVVFAVLENDIRRLLGYHIVSQVGYMVAGVGLGTPLALNGTAAHAFAHILYKGLLLMGAGAVVHATGRRKLSELGGLAGSMPAVLALYMVGALSISGAPLLNGFVSKSLIVAAAEAEHRPVVFTLLVLASVGTFLSVGLKLPWLAFGGTGSGASVRAVPPAMLAAMTLTGALCVLTGVAPSLLYALLPFPLTYEPYTATHVLEALQGLTGTALAFVLLRRQLVGKPAVALDTDRLWRAGGAWVSGRLAPAIARAAVALEAAADAAVSRPVGPMPRATGRPVGYAVLLAVAAVGIALVAFR